MTSALDQFAHFVRQKYGQPILTALLSYYDDPTLTTIDIRNATGLSRERIRQWLNRLYGNRTIRKMIKDTAACGLQKMTEVSMSMRINSTG